MDALRVSDEALVQASRQGDLTSFNLLVDRYQGQVYNVALRMLRDSAAAEDVTQDTFLSAYRNIGSYRGGIFRAWLFRIATNAARDVLRRRARRPATSLDTYMEGETTPRDIPDPATGPEETALQHERQRVLGGLLMELPPDQRTVLVLSDVQGLSYEEIAQATGEALGTVKSRLNRARTRLRDLLRDQRELFPTVQRHNQ